MSRSGFYNWTAIDGIDGYRLNGNFRPTKVPESSYIQQVSVLFFEDLTPILNNGTGIDDYGLTRGSCISDVSSRESWDGLYAWRALYKIAHSSIQEALSQRQSSKIHRPSLNISWKT